ncbi:MAG TPA: hypothetical protein VF789_18100 [Thermoanaerobaculia bacterium]
MRLASWIFALAVLLAAPAAAGELPALAPAPDTPQVGVPAPVNADCGFNLETVLPGKSGLCPAPKNAAVMPSLPGLEGSAETAEFLAGFRTCRCSCGAPCKTDADCGPGGRCSAGITCC